jgi:hypothetical protein
LKWAPLLLERIKGQPMLHSTKQEPQRKGLRRTKMNDPQIIQARRKKGIPVEEDEGFKQSKTKASIFEVVFVFQKFHHCISTLSFHSSPSSQ